MASSLPESTTSSNAILRGDLAAAAERRTSAKKEIDLEAQHAKERELRLNFRRLVDPGITRPNSQGTAYISIKTLLTISENLLREPDNLKYSQFKPTNSAIKKNLVDVKGALEYAVALGFRAEVQNFQPFYVFNKHKKDDLRIGCAILKEYCDRETEKLERSQRSGAAEKAARESAARNALLAFEDDRKSKALHDEREKQRRAAVVAAGPGQTSQSPGRPTSTVSMPGSGISLDGEVYHPSSPRTDRDDAEGD